MIGDLDVVMSHIYVHPRCRLSFSHYRCSCGWSVFAALLHAIWRDKEVKKGQGRRKFRAIVLLFRAVEIRDETLPVYGRGHYITTESPRST
jgi:hypothetical protein